MTPNELVTYVREQNLALYLQFVTTSELAEVAQALMGECLARGIQVAGPLGTAIARIEARA